MDLRGRDLMGQSASGSIEARTGWRSRLERVVGAFLLVGAGVGLIVWLMFLGDAVLGGGGLSVSVGGSPAPRRLGVFLLTPVVFGLAGTQAFLGMGLFKQRAWVGWFGLLYVLGAVVGAGLVKVLPAGGLLSLTAPVLGTLPTWVFIARWMRGELRVEEDH
jgi:hypothetical protein